ncbi:hypothetical protein Syun_023926 [Stephania yunnanensis]|uniref:Glucosamine 6-phosphate N-acetyltransferase n=1 Tax=Stephania yunnanensis TaxID=152371 RepID=A0AAP0FDN9_9MAGN
MSTNESNETLDRFYLRRLELSDKSKGFIDLLQQLSAVGSISDEEFEERFHELASRGEEHVICVVEDRISRRIVATGTVFVEKKFLRGCGKAGHIEDVVVDASARGAKLGKKVVDSLVEHARLLGCYKVILDCSMENKGFYKKCGFEEKAVQMAIYF